MCVCFKRIKECDRVVAFHSVCMCVCESESIERKGEIFGVVVSRQRCVCEGVNSSSVWTVLAEQGSSTSDEHFTRSLRHPFFLLPLFSVSQWEGLIYGQTTHFRATTSNDPHSPRHTTPPPYTSPATQHHRLHLTAYISHYPLRQKDRDTELAGQWPTLRTFVYSAVLMLKRNPFYL